MMTGCVAPATQPVRIQLGVVVPMVTPFKADGTGDLDEDGLRALTDWLCRRPVDGLFPMGATGEFKKLSLDERRRVIDVVVDAARGRVPVLPHVGAGTLEDTLELARYAQSAGAEAVSVIVPEEGDLLAYFTAIDRAVTVPIVIYDPKPSITPAIMDRLAAMEHVKGIKYRSKDMRETMRVVAAARGRVNLLAGHEQYLLPTLAVGGTGAIGGGGNVFPELFAAVCARWEKGDHAGALAAQLELDRASQLLSKGDGPLMAKVVLARLGVPIAPVTREPCRPIGPEQEEAIRELVALLGHASR